MNEEAIFEKNRVVQSAVKSLIMALLIAVAFVVNSTFSLRWEEYGLQPRSLAGLRGILTMTFLHSDVSHLFSNLIPLFMLSFGLFYYFPGKALIIIVLLTITTGILTWTIGRDGNHIGASGLVYALAFFLVTISIIKMETSMLAFTLIIIFLYGSMIWGFFPQLFPDKHISWEGHLAGAISGVIAAIIYRNEGPKRKEYFPDEEEDVNTD
ncbi:MAG: rhomboid family intramembrane serine protease [Bacteroidales bacterium]|jgi:membrane associated rhomboid family serine protease|nr:rhomboid family intramembrane serine protease [Bacteroidales bacterium]